MSRLGKIQKDFLAQFITHQDQFIAHIKEGGIPSAERYQVYEQSILNILSKALAISFPTVWQLVGQGPANQLAHDFARENLPTTGCLELWGEGFSTFLKNDPRLKNYGYLADVAQYDYVCHQAYCASDDDEQETIDILDVNQHASQFLMLHPSVGLVSSIFPLNKIIDVAHNPQAERLKLTRQPVYALVYRDPKYRVKTRWIDEALFDFIKALQEAPLGQACVRVNTIYPNFNPFEAVDLLWREDIVAGFQSGLSGA